MIDSFIGYIERLELLTFFSGYPLVYTFVHFITGGKRGQRIHFLSTIHRSLPKAYALSASIYFLLWIREIIIQLGVQNMDPDFNITPLKLWAFLAVFFWVPALARRSVYSLLHSLIFFFLFCKELIAGISSSGPDILSNGMKVYTVSLALNVACLLAVCATNWIFTKIFPRR
jgi:hypothetical protein